jgi:PIN domain nuclease of toxin-antitoxin system
MRLLIDTQCWLWMNASPERMSSKALSLLRDPKNERLLSAASIWEIGIKFQIGKLALPAPPRVYVPSRMALTLTNPLAIREAHALGVVDLPAHHRDPFDRMLISQALMEGIPIVTSDRQFARYDVEIVAA